MSRKIEEAYAVVNVRTSYNFGGHRLDESILADLENVRNQVLRYVESVISISMNVESVLSVSMNVVIDGNTYDLEGQKQKIEELLEEEEEET